MPSRAWKELVMDFFGPIPNGNELMVILDEFSRFPVVEEVKTTAAEYVLPKMDDVFSLMGIPTDLGTDNGPPFNGSRFTSFCDYYGINHTKITPYHPPANGKAEKFMTSLGKVFRNAITEKKDWRQELNSFLRNYRSTPHVTTGIAPATLLFGDNRTNRLPKIIEEVTTIDEYTKLARERDDKAKSEAKTYTDKRKKSQGA